MKKLYFLLLLSASILMSSCGKDKEVVGPTGPAGVDGVNGTNGTNGTNGLDGFLTQGSISGKINGNMSNGDTINEPFSFSKFSTWMENSSYSYEGEGGYRVNVYRGGADPDSYLSFSFGSDDLTVKPDSSEIDLDFQFSKSISDSTFLMFAVTEDYSQWLEVRKSARYFNDWNGHGRLTINNYSYTTSTGRMKFDYIINVSEFETTSGYPAKISGTVDIQVKVPVYKTAAK